MNTLSHAVCREILWCALTYKHFLSFLSSFRSPTHTLSRAVGLFLSDQPCKLRSYLISPELQWLTRAPVAVVTSDIICWQERPKKETWEDGEDKQPTQKTKRCIAATTQGGELVTHRPRYEFYICSKQSCGCSDEGNGFDAKIMFLTETEESSCAITFKKAKNCWDLYTV